MVKDYIEKWRILQFLGKQSYLLANLMTLLILLPLLRSTLLARIGFGFLLTLIMITGHLSISTRRSEFYISLVLGLLMIGLTWVDVFYGNPVLLVASRCVAAVFFLLLSLLIFSHYLFGIHQVTGETLIAAVNAYLCMGIMYAFGYYGLMFVDPNSFSGLFMETLEFPDCVYLSFVTMTTLGYGDITPQTEIAAVLTWSQAVVGQLFVALIVARIVGVMVAKDSS